MKKLVYTKNDQIVANKIGDEYVLVPISDNIADMDNVFSINEVGSFIWEHINGKNSVQDIIQMVLNEFDVDEKTAEYDVENFIREIEPFLEKKEC